MTDWGVIAVVISSSAVTWAMLVMFARGLGRLEGRFEQFEKRVDQRFDDMQRHMDQRFDALDHRLDRFEELLRQRTVA